MRSICQEHYYNTVRWDAISKSPIKSQRDIPLPKSCILHLHEINTKTYKDRFLLAMYLELLTGQSVSPQMLTKGSYKTILAGKRAKTSTHAQVTLRKKHLFRFLDKWILTSLDKTTTPSFSTKNSDNFTFYYTNPFSFLETSALNINLHKMNSLQIHMHVMNNENVKQHFLNNFQIIT